MRLHLLLLILLILSSVSAEPKTNSSYRYTIQQYDIKYGTNHIHSFQMAFYLGNGSYSSYPFSEGNVFTLTVVYTQFEDPHALNLPSDLPHGSSWFDNSSSQWDLIRLHSKYQYDVEFALQKGKVQMNMYEAYDAYDFVVNASQFRQVAGADYFSNATYFGVQVSNHSRFMINHQIYDYDSYYSATYQNNGMLFDYHATAHVQTGNQTVRTLNMHIIQQSEPLSKISYYPMFIALLPLLLLKRRVNYA